MLRQWPFRIHSSPGHPYLFYHFQGISKMHETIIIIDFGAQYAQLIARRVREAHVYCEIVPCTESAENIRRKNPKGIILSGGPRSVYENDAPNISRELFDYGIPILGICYGHQLLAFHFRGEVNTAARREFGKAYLHIDDQSDLFKGIVSPTIVWMSHGDSLSRIPEGFEAIGHTENAPLAAMRNSEKHFYGIQFHPEVMHTDEGRKILNNFLFSIVGCAGDWTPGLFVQESIANIQSAVGAGRVICALSGGVDSSVTSVLLHKALGPGQFTPIFVDNGLLRKGEREQVEKTFRSAFRMDLHVVDAREQFLSALSGITDPEQKRKIIGKTFIHIFEREAIRIGKVDFLAQGTLYPDLIESVSFKGPSATIKSHHNVGGLPEKMNLKLIEPLRELFKDEVRKVGNELGIPQDILGRHPFPGPGLAIRVLGEVTPERLALVSEADAIFIEEIKKAGLYDEIWQALTVLLPVQSVGVMGDSRTYENVAALRAVTSLDGMTADWFPMPPDILGKISNRIINEIRGINRVVYDVSSKPPSTIEWE